MHSPKASIQGSSHPSHRPITAPSLTSPSPRPVRRYARARLTLPTASAHSAAVRAVRALSGSRTTATTPHAVSQAVVAPSRRLGSRCATASTLPAHPSSAYTGMAVSVAAVVPIRLPHQAHKRHRARASSPCGAVPRRPGCLSVGYSSEAGGSEASESGSVVLPVLAVAPSAASSEVTAAERAPASDLSSSLRGSCT